LGRGDLAALRAMPALDLKARLETERGDTPLTWACRHKQAAAARWLLLWSRARPEVDGTTDNGAMALAIASQQK
jgi:hypothetical protein